MNFSSSILYVAPSISLMNKSVDALVEDPDIIGTYVSTHCYKPPYFVSKNWIKQIFFSHSNLKKKLNIKKKIKKSWIFFTQFRVKIEIFGAKIHIYNIFWNEIFQNTCQFWRENSNMSKNQFCQNWIFGHKFDFQDSV